MAAPGPAFSGSDLGPPDDPFDPLKEIRTAPSSRKSVPAAPGLKVMQPAASSRTSPFVRRMSQPLHARAGGDLVHEAHRAGFHNSGGCCRAPSAGIATAARSGSLAGAAGLSGTRPNRVPDRSGLQRPIHRRLLRRRWVWRQLRDWLRRCRRLARWVRLDFGGFKAASGRVADAVRKPPNPSFMKSPRPARLPVRSGSSSARASFSTSEKLGASSPDQCSAAGSPKPGSHSNSGSGVVN